MNLVEVFSPQTNQEFPPKVVYAYANGKPVSLDAKQLAEYDTMYREAGVTTVHSNITGKNYEFPFLVAK